MVKHQQTHCHTTNSNQKNVSIDKILNAKKFCKTGSNNSTDEKFLLKYKEFKAKKIHNPFQIASSEEATKIETSINYIELETTLSILKGKYPGLDRI